MPHRRRESPAFEKINEGSFMKNVVKTLARRSMVAAALLTMAVATTLHAAPPAVLAELPSDAKAVVVITSVKDLGAKVSNVGVRLGIALPPDLAGWATRSVGITKGFDAAGSAALAVVTVPGEEENGPPAMVLLLPTTDPKAMMESFQPAAEDKAGVSEITLPNDRAEKGYMATVGNGKWVVLAQDRAALDAYLARKNPLDKALSADALKTFESNDLVAWANIPILAGPVDKMLEARQEDFLNMMGMFGPRMDPTALAMQKAVLREYFGGLRQYIKDANAAMMTVRLSDAGLTLGTVASFKPETPFGKFVAAQKNAKAVSFQGLPNGEVLMAGSFNWDAASVSTQFADAFKRITSDEALAKDPKSKDLANVSEQVRQIMALVNGGSIVLLDPGAAGAKNGIFQGAYVLDSTDPEKLKNLMLEMMKNPAIKSGAMSGGLKQNVTITADAVTIKSTKLTKIQTTVSLEDTAENPASDAAKRNLEAFKALYGPDGMTLYASVIGKRLLIVLGSDARILESSVAAAETNANELPNNQLLAGSKDQVLPNAIAAVYLSPGKLVTAMQHAMPPGAPALNINAGTQPIVISAAVKDSSLTAEVHIPTATITALKDLGMSRRAPGVPGGAPDQPVPPNDGM
jgi:hypothetical protein